MARNNSATRRKVSRKNKLTAALGKLSSTQGTSIKVSATSSTKQTALAYVYAMGCTISSEKIDYSLLDEQTDKENIENENIDQSKKFSRIKAGTKLATDKFANNSDQFYELDDDLTERVKTVNASIAAATTPNLTDFAMSISKM